MGFTTTGSAKLTMIHNHWLSIAHNMSQPLAQDNSQWFTTTGSADSIFVGINFVDFFCQEL
jgi:hypothetical protein